MRDKEMKRFVNADKTVSELLERYPNGFAVGPHGHISKTLMAASYFQAIAQQYAFSPPNGGYLVVEMVENGVL